MKSTDKKMTDREQRETFYKGEISGAQIKVQGHTYSISILDLNRNGAGIFISTEEAKLSLTKGSELILSFFVDQASKIELHGIVCNSSQFRSSGVAGTRVGISFLLSHSSIDQRPVQNEKRKSRRIIIPEFFRPVGFCENPFKLLEQIHFHITDCSSTGLSCITSARNRVLIPGLALRITVFLPGSGTFILQGKVSNIRMSESKDRLTFGFNFKEREESFLEAFVEMVLMAGVDVSLKELKSQGFPVGMAVKGFSIGYPKNRSDMTDIMKLRLHAQHHQGRFLEKTDPWSMEDEYDCYSRHICAWSGKKLVAATRLVFSDGDIKRCEHAPMGATIPDWLMKARFLESSRSVTHPDFRGGDLFISLTRHMGRVVLQSGHRYMVSSCEDKLLSFYLRSGCKKVNSFYCPDMPGIKWHLLVIDMEATVKSMGVDPLTWNVVHEPLAKFLFRDQKSLTFMERTKSSLYRTVSTLAHKVYRKHKAKSSKKSRT